MKWKLNSNEVSYSCSGSSSGGTFARKTKVTSSRIQLAHKPTNIKVEGEVLPGHYSKKEMQKLKTELEKRLFIELELKL